MPSLKSSFSPTERTIDGFPLCLTDIPLPLHEAAQSDLVAKDAGGFLCFAASHVALNLVMDTMLLLQHLGIYEEALVSAFRRAKRNNFSYSLPLLSWLFVVADRQKLRDAGDPLPSPGPYTLYRGVAGRGAARRVRGLFWTGSLDCATWFARRSADFGWADPAVFRALVPESDVLSYTNARKEDEYIVLLSPQTRVKKSKRLLPDEPETC